MGDKPVVFESCFSDYRPVNGVMIAFTILSRTKGEPGNQRIILDSVQLDTPMADQNFAMPGPVWP